MKDSSIHIALGCNTKFAPGLWVAAGSLALHYAGNEPIVFHVLDFGLTCHDKQILMQVLTKTERDFSVEYLTPDLSCFSGLPSWRGNYIAYARCLLHGVLPDVHAVIYLDVDVYWGRDVGELWAMRDVSSAIWAASDSLTTQNPTSSYFASGVMLMNLDWLRKNNFTETMIEYAKTHELHYPDMDILNGTLSKSATLIAPMWDLQENCIWTGALADPAVIHYTRNKPWLSLTHSPVAIPSLPWWDFYWRFIGFRGPLRIVGVYVRGFIKFHVFKHQWVLRFLCWTPRSRTKLPLLGDLFLRTTERNRHVWFLEKSKDKRGAGNGKVVSE